MTGGTPAAIDPRCRWHEDPNGRCGDPVAFPAAGEAPPFCARHLLRLEPWIRARASARQASPGEWIAWAARQAADTEDALKALGVLRPSRALDAGRPVWPAGPERR